MPQSISSGLSLVGEVVTVVVIVVGSLVLIQVVSGPNMD